MKTLLIGLAVILVVVAGVVVGTLVSRPEPVWPQVCQEMVSAGDPATPVLVCLPVTVTPPPTWGAETRAAYATWESQRAQVAP